MLFDFENQFQIYFHFVGKFQSDIHIHVRCNNLISNYKNHCFETHI